MTSVVLLLDVGGARLQRRHVVAHGLFLFTVIDHLREVELRLAFVRLTADRLLRNVRLAVDVDLLPLKFQIRFNDSLDCAHVRTAVQMECFDELRHAVRILPLLHPLEEAEVDEHDSWRPADSRGAVDVHCEAHIVDHVVQMLRNHKQIGTIVVFVII